MTKNHTIVLSHLKPLGKGSHRSCYIHPENSNLVIKVIHSKSPMAQRMNNHELNYYRRITSTLKDWSGVPKYYGKVNTDLGEGLVFDCVRDDDGQISKTLDYYLNNCQTKEEALHLVEVIRRFKRYLQEHLIVTIDLRAHNMLCKKTATGDLLPVICDNLGTHAFIPVVCWFKFLSLKQHDKRWAGFMKTSVMQSFLKRFDLPIIQ